jgi:hypothetical protein
MTHQTMTATFEKTLFRGHGRLLRTSEALRLGIHPWMLYAIRKQGVLEQLSRGLYRLAELPPLGAPDLVAVAARPHPGSITPSDANLAVSIAGARSSMRLIISPTWSPRLPFFSDRLPKPWSQTRCLSMSGTLQDRGVVWKALDSSAWAINNNDKHAGNLTVQHTDVDRFQRSDGSILGTQCDRISRLTVEPNLRFNQD